MVVEAGRRGTGFERGGFVLSTTKDRRIPFNHYESDGSRLQPVAIWASCQWEYGLLDASTVMVERALVYNTGCLSRSQRLANVCVHAVVS